MRGTDSKSFTSSSSLSPADTFKYNLIADCQAWSRYSSAPFLSDITLYMLSNQDASEKNVQQPLRGFCTKLPTLTPFDSCACTVNVMYRQAYMRGLWLIGNLLRFNVFREARFSRTEGTSENVETLNFSLE